MKISERAALLNRMYSEETELDKLLLELAREIERVMDRRDAIAVCRKALERSEK